MSKRIVTIFGSGRVSSDSQEYTDAYNLGRLLAQNGFYICNGGYGGTMEATAKGAKLLGGKTIGVLVKTFGTKSNQFIDEIILTDTLLERLVKLVELGDAYVILPGATGTLLELATIWEFMLKGLMRKKTSIVLGNFWDSVIETINKQLKKEKLDNFINYIQKANTIEECIEILIRT